MREIMKSIRNNFPQSREEGSDGYAFTRIFSGRTTIEAYEKLKIFLSENGYRDIPVPEDLDELYLMMGEDRLEGKYKHNPIEISFFSYNTKQLLLTIYDESYPNHLLLFHDKYDISTCEGFLESSIDDLLHYLRIKSKIKKSEYKPDLVELWKKSKVLIDLQLDKKTILASLLLEAYQREFISEKEIRLKFGTNVYLQLKKLYYFQF